MQKYLRIESFSPFNHRRVKMRMRNRNGADAAARSSPRRRFRHPAMKYSPRADFRRAIARAMHVARWQIPVRCRFREARRFVFEAVVMITREPIKRGPFLTGVTNELPFVLADGTGGWRLCSLVKLRSALDADEVFHGVISVTQASLPAWSSRLSQPALMPAAQAARAIGQPGIGCQLRRDVSRR